jgi:hypothetical protein
VSILTNQEAKVNAITTRVVELLVATPAQDQHRDCGVNRRPCRDCRLTAPLPCIDSEVCGIDDFCRPCAATWRCRLWRANHLRFVCEFHRAVERFPALAHLHPDPHTAAAIWRELRRAIRLDVARTVRRLLVNELPEAIHAIREV